MSNYSAFFYGSLMSKTVLLRVLCGANVTEQDKTLKLNSIRLFSASLKGYTRSSLKGEDYPAMTYTGNPDDTVDGVICQCLTQKDIEALDVFEGDWYKRIPVKVFSATDKKDAIDTETYLYVGDTELLTGAEWDFSYFLSSGKEQKWLNDRCDFFEVDKLHC
ncbi:unnamed protein product [Mucor hiemalis]